MRKALLCLYLFISISFHSSAQLENANWHFGNYAGLTFSGSPLSPYSNSSQLVAQTGYSGCSSSVSDVNGAMLFYTDGLHVYDKTHNLMPNGSDLFGAVENITGKQNSVIIKKPGQQNIYYIFTISYFNPGWSTLGRGGVHYSVVDMSLHSGNGDVVSGLKNISLNSHNNIPIDYDYSTGTGLRIYPSKITSGLHKDGDKVWLSVFPFFQESGVNKLYSYSYLVSATGINNVADGTPVAPTTYDLLDNAHYNPYIYSVTNGITKISPDGKFLCDTDERNANLYDFNNANGHVSFNRSLYSADPNSGPWTGCGVEFSPNSGLVYFSARDFIYQSAQVLGGGARKKYMHIYQCNVKEEGIIEVGKFPFADSTGFGTDNIITPLPSNMACGLQLGPDNKVYVANNSTSYQMDYLGIIHSPDVPGTSCNYVQNGIQLLTNSFHFYTLPQWVYKTVPQAWPKVYNAGKGIHNLATDNNGNIFATLSAVADISVNYNHIGALPPTIYLGNYTVQYRPSGLTDWTKTTEFSHNVLSPSKIQVYSQNSFFIFCDASTGAQVPDPPFTSSADEVIAETNNNEVISVEAHDRKIITVRSLQGSNSLTLTFVGSHRYNKLTNKLYVVNGDNLNIYSITTNALNLLLSVPIPSLSIGLFVDNQDKVYFVKDQMLQHFDYSIPTPTLTPVSIPGFNNSNIKYISCRTLYTEDVCLVYQEQEGNIYYIDFNSLTKKKIPVVNPPISFSSYIFDGNDVYLAGRHNAPFIIGTQNVPIVGGLIVGSSFITKLNTQTDFNSLYSMKDMVKRKDFIVHLDIFPNPSYNSVKVDIKPRDNQRGSFLYSLIITNNIGRKVLVKKLYNSSTLLDISNLEKGIYYIEVQDQYGAKTARTLLKL